MQEDILREVVSSVAGDKARGIVELLFNKKNVNEFLIAKKLKLTINQTRNILYKLADEGLVSFIRKKDSKKGGWYTYFWTINLDKGLLKFKDGINKNIEHLKHQIKSKKIERFYFSPNCNLEFSEESALNNDYICLECGEVLRLKDNSKEVAAFEKDLLKNEEMMQKVDSEIKIAEGKNLKIKIRRFKIEEQNKKAERNARRKKKQKEIAKLKKGSAKKPVLKKSAKKKSKKR